MVGVTLDRLKLSLNAYMVEVDKDNFCSQGHKKIIFLKDDFK